MISQKFSFFIVLLHFSKMLNWVLFRCFDTFLISLKFLKGSGKFKEILDIFTKFSFFHKIMMFKVRNFWKVKPTKKS